MLVAIALLANVAFAFPSLDSVRAVERDDPNPWLGVPPGGVRAPCPGLNTLANHGFINRDGKNITGPMLTKAFLDAFNVGPGVVKGGLSTTFNICKNVTGETCTQFDLDILNLPHRMEHDGSLTRLDYEMSFDLAADNHHFNATIWNMTKSFFGDGATHVDIAHAQIARAQRFVQSQQQDAPGWFISVGSLSKTETAFYLSVTNDPAMGRNVTDPLSRLEWIDYWFTNERLPTDLGWAKPTVMVTQPDIAHLAQSLGNSPKTPLASTTTLPSTQATAVQSQTSTPTAAGLAASPTGAIRRRVSRNHETHKERNGPPVVPMSALPSVLAQPGGPSKVAKAAAVATAAAPQAPVYPNLYLEAHSAQEFNTMVAQAQAYVKTVQGAFGAALGQLLQ